MTWLNTPPPEAVRSLGTGRQAGMRPAGAPLGVPAAPEDQAAAFAASMAARG